MVDINISIAKDFSRTPGSRKIVEGDFSGELFLNTILEPKFKSVLKSGGKIIVNLDGTRGYATSFLEEVFGGLARKYNPEDVLKHVEPISINDPYLVQDINSYIKHAQE